MFYLYFQGLDYMLVVSFRGLVNSQTLHISSLTWKVLRVSSGEIIYFWLFLLLHLFIQQILTECPLCARRHSFKHLEWTSEWNQDFCLCEVYTTHSGILAWRIPWTEEPGALQFMGSQRVGHDWATKHSTARHTHKEWRWLGFFKGSLASCHCIWKEELNQKAKYCTNLILVN